MWWPPTRNIARCQSYSPSESRVNRKMMKFVLDCSQPRPPILLCFSWKLWNVKLNHSSPFGVTFPVVHVIDDISQWSRYVCTTTATAHAKSMANAHAKQINTTIRNVIAIQSFNFGVTCGQFARYRIPSHQKAKTDSHLRPFKNNRVICPNAHCEWAMCWHLKRLETSDALWWNPYGWLIHISSVFLILSWLTRVSRASHNSKQAWRACVEPQRVANEHVISCLRRRFVSLYGTNSCVFLHIRHTHALARTHEARYGCVCIAIAIVALASRRKQQRAPFACMCVVKC